MKNFIYGVLTILFLSTAVTVQSQDEISSYEMSYFNDSGNSKKSIQATEPNDKGLSTFYIYTSPLEGKHVSLIISSKDLEQFKIAINSIKEIYTNWSQTAKENGIVDLDKEIDFQKTKQTSAFYSSKWFFTTPIQLRARFKILSNGDHVLIIQNKYKLVSSSNEFINNKGFLIVFNSVEEIDNFLNQLNIELVYSHYENKDSKEDLFKQ